MGGWQGLLPGPPVSGAGVAVAGVVLVPVKVPWHVVSRTAGTVEKPGAPGRCAEPCPCRSVPSWRLLALQPPRQAKEPVERALPGAGGPGTRRLPRCSPGGAWGRLPRGRVRGLGVRTTAQDS